MPVTPSIYLCIDDHTRLKLAEHSELPPRCDIQKLNGRGLCPQVSPGFAGPYGTSGRLQPARCSIGPLEGQWGATRRVRMWREGLVLQWGWCYGIRRTRTAVDTRPCRFNLCRCCQGNTYSYEGRCRVYKVHALSARSSRQAGPVQGPQDLAQLLGVSGDTLA